MKRRASRGAGRRPGAGLTKGLLLAGAAVGLPVLISEVIRRRAEPPQAPRWGRAHRYAGALGEVVFQEIGQETGSGSPPLLLLHSLGPGYDANQWRGAAELLASGHEIYAPDLPGWGRSEPPLGGHSAAACVTMIEDFLHGVVREPAVLVAAGASAAYAVRLAVERPDQVLALVLVTPLGLASDGTAAEGAGPAFLRRLLRIPVLRTTMLDLLTSRSALTHHLRKEVYSAPERVDAALLDHHYRASHAPRARTALRSYLQGDFDLDIEEDLERLDVPVLLAWGRSAAAAPVENADLWLRHLPDADLEVFPGTGDLPQVESAIAFCRAVERFIAQV